MTYFIKSGNIFNVTPTAAIDIYEELPLGTYTVGFNQMKESYYLERIEDFPVPGKIYGNTMKTVERFHRTFADRSNSTGIMLSGEKGSGKTLLAKLLSLKGLELGIPTIVINDPWNGDLFNKFIQTINQPTIIIFDEFEKVYDREEQERMLTLLDGVYPSKKMFILTCNDKYRVNHHMKNRPGRIFYRMDFRGLDVPFIVEYCQDNLINKTHIDAVCKVSSVFAEFNFDMLKALVEEMNRYDESPAEALELLNAKPDGDDNQVYSISMWIKGVPLPEDSVMETRWNGNPFLNPVYNEYLEPNENPDEGVWQTVTFSPSDILKADYEEGTFTFKSGDVTLKMVREKKKSFVWDAF